MLEKVQCPKEAQGEGDGVGWGQCLSSVLFLPAPPCPSGGLLWDPPLSTVGPSPVHCGTFPCLLWDFCPVHCGTFPCWLWDPCLARSGSTWYSTFLPQHTFHGAQSLPFGCCSSSLVCLVLCCGIWSHAGEAQRGTVPPCP